MEQDPTFPVVTTLPNELGVERNAAAEQVPSGLPTITH
jgi:hypothetical protein